MCEAVDARKSGRPHAGLWAHTHTAARSKHTPAFIDVDGLFAAAHEPLAKAEELFSS